MTGKKGNKNKGKRRKERKVRKRENLSLKTSPTTPVFEI